MWRKKMLGNHHQVEGYEELQTSELCQVDKKSNPMTLGTCVLKDARAARERKSCRAGPVWAEICGRSGLHCIRNALLQCKYVCLSELRPMTLFSRKSTTQTKASTNFPLQSGSPPPPAHSYWPHIHGKQSSVQRNEVDMVAPRNLMFNYRVTGHVVWRVVKTGIQSIFLR